MVISQIHKYFGIAKFGTRHHNEHLTFDLAHTSRNTSEASCNMSTIRAQHTHEKELRIHVTSIITEP